MRWWRLGSGGLEELNRTVAMIGLIALGSIGLWLAASVWVAWRVARLTKRAWLRALIFVSIAPLLVAAPLADEIIGKYQFTRYCENAKEVKFYDQIPVGEELYTSDGRWRLSAVQDIPQEERNRLNQLVSSIIRWDQGPQVPPEVSAAIPIQEYVKTLYDARDGRLLAEWRQFTNYGGWLKRNFGVGGATGGFLLPQRCAPTVVRQNQVSQQILVFRGIKGNK